MVIIITTLIQGTAEMYPPKLLFSEQPVGILSEISRSYYLFMPSFDTRLLLQLWNFFVVLHIQKPTISSAC